MELWKQFRWSVGYRGFGGTLRFAAGALARRAFPGRIRVEVHPFDREHGTDTGGLILGHKLGSGSANAIHITGYAGVPPSRMGQLLGLWQQALGPGESVRAYGFVDIGCGKGRALLLASEWPFREARGIELDPELARIAQANAASWVSAGRARCPLLVVPGDALSVELPAGPCLIFLYNPFAAPVTAALLDRLARRARTEQGPLYLIYYKENDHTPTRHDRRLELLWRGLVPLAPEDRIGEPVASDDDDGSLYRWIG